MTDTTPAVTPEQIEWAAELAGCESWFQGQTRIVCESHGNADWPCPVAVDLAAETHRRGPTSVTRSRNSALNTSASGTGPTSSATLTKATSLPFGPPCKRAARTSTTCQRSSTAGH